MIAKTSIPQFQTQKELFNFLIENKSILIAEKKSQNKICDTISHIPQTFEKSEVNKAISDPSTFTGDTIKVISVLNTTNIMDSHSDVHLPGLWNKTLKENKNIYLLEEHNMSFRTIISDKVKASVTDKNWNELGLNAVGKTQALIFESTISKSRNPYMFEQYLNGYVKQHSVGMRYSKIEMAVNNSEYKEEFAVWGKYIDEVINKKEAEAQGYFWAVTEAKLIEGSAVVIGSNQITPTLDVKEKTEPLESTQKEIEPIIITHNAIKQITNFKFI